MTLRRRVILRLDALQSLGTSASGVSLATSTGDILEVTCYGPGVFRLRAGPNTKPDYGLVVGRAKACAVEPGEDGAWKFTAGDATLELAAAPLRFRLLHRGTPIAGSITDEHFRGSTRLPAFGRAAPGRAVDCGPGARVGRARVRPRRKIRPAQQARAARSIRRSSMRWA